MVQSLTCTARHNTCDSVPLTKESLTEIARVLPNLSADAIQEIAGPLTELIQAAGIAFARISR